MTATMGRGVPCRVRFTAPWPRRRTDSCPRRAVRGVRQAASDGHRRTRRARGIPGSARRLRHELTGPARGRFGNARCPAAGGTRACRAFARYCTAPDFGVRSGWFGDRCFSIESGTLPVTYRGTRRREFRGMLPWVEWRTQSQIASSNRLHEESKVSAFRRSDGGTA